MELRREGRPGPDPPGASGQPIQRGLAVGEFSVAWSGLAEKSPRRVSVKGSNLAQP